MVDFRKMLSPRTRRENKARLDRILAFQEMNRSEMAVELLSASRTLIESGLFPLPGSVSDFGNDDWALYRCIPAMALCLDPDLELHAYEVARPAEGWDPLVRVKSGDHDEILRSLELIVCHRLFSNAQAGSEEVNMAADFLHHQRGRWSAMEIAMDTVSPGMFPGRTRAAMEAPLGGYQLIASHGDHDRVERYSESKEDLDELFRVTVAKRQGEDLSEDEEQALRKLRSWPERLDFDALSLQTCEGEIFDEVHVMTSPRSQVTPDEFEF